MRTGQTNVAVAANFTGPAKSLNLTKSNDVLKANAFAKLSIANPTAAPYGAAAIEAIKGLAVYDTLSTKIVQGNSTARAFQFIETGNAELGFVALSQLPAVTDGSRWMVPQNLYKPTRQDAVLLKKGADADASKAFVGFLKSPESRAVIEEFGYVLEYRSVQPLPSDIRQPVRLTVELAAITTIALLLIATPLALYIGYAVAGMVEGRRRSDRIAADRAAAAGGAGLLSALAARPERTRRRTRDPLGRAHACFHVRRIDHRVDHLHALCRAAHSQLIQSDGRAATRSRGDAARLAGASVLDHRPASRSPGL